MTDEEKAEEYANACRGKIKDLHWQDVKYAVLYGLSEGRKEGYEQGKNNERELQCGQKNYEKDIARLEKENEELKEKLNKKDCEDCFFYAEGDKCDKGIYYASGTSVCNKFVGR